MQKGIRTNDLSSSSWKEDGVLEATLFDAEKAGFSYFQGPSEAIEALDQINLLWNVEMSKRY